MAARNNEVQKKLREHSKTRVENSAEPDDAFDDSAEHDDTGIFESKSDSDSSDNVGSSSVEIKVEQLLAEVEAEAASGGDASGRVRRRLEAMTERKRRHQALLDFDDYDLDS